MIHPNGGKILMHRIRRALPSLTAGPLTLLTVFALAVTLSACGGRNEEPAPAAPATEAAPPAPQVDPAPVIEQAPEPSPIAREKTHYPASTLPVLALRPQSAVISLGLPPMQGVIDRGFAYAERVLPRDVPVRAEYDRWVDQFAEDLDIDNAETLSDIAVGIGLDPARPAGIFLGGDKIIAAIADLEAQAAAIAEAGETEGEEPVIEDDGGINLDAIDFDAAMETPDFAILLPCADCEKTVEVFRGLAGDLPGVDLNNPIEVEVGDVTILQFGDAVSYFVTDEWFAVGTALELLTGIADRFDSPATTKYGTPACPAFSPEEIVALLQADQLADIMEAGARVSDLLGANMGATAIAQMEGTITAYRDSDDPVVMTLRLDEQEFELLTRVDTTERPNIFDTTGQPGPLSLTAALPANTPVFIGWRLTDAQKAQMAEQAEGGAGMPMPGEAQATIERLINVLGDELAIATTGPGLLPIAPKLALMFRINDQEEIADMLSEMKAATGAVFSATDFNGVEINTLQPGQVPILTLSYAIVDDIVVFSIMAPDSSELMSLVDGLQEGAPSDLFASLDPPLDPQAPLYNVVVLNGNYVSSLLGTASSFFPQARAANDMLGGFLGTVNELRIVSGIEGDWLVQQVSLAIKPAPAELPQQPLTGTK
jgi:hypothetical protein